MQAAKLEQQYEGKAKRIFATDRPEVLWLEYKNDLTAFNGAKKESLEHKGKYTNLISAEIFSRLAAEGIESHFISKISETEQYVKHVRIIPLETVVRNITAGSICKRLGIPEKQKLPTPLLEFYYKNDDLNDPIITEDHAKLFGWATAQDIETIKTITVNVNNQLTKLFSEIGIILVDFKLEFGRTADGRIILADEISPDTCRLWDAETMEKLDKDRFRNDLGNVLFAYQEILRRLTAA